MALHYIFCVGVVSHRAIIVTVVDESLVYKPTSGVIILSTCSLPERESQDNLWAGQIC